MNFSNYGIFRPYGDWATQFLSARNLKSISRFTEVNLRDDAKIHKESNPADHEEDQGKPRATKGNLHGCSLNESHYNTTLRLTLSHALPATSCITARHKSMSCTDSRVWSLLAQVYVVYSRVDSTILYRYVYRALKRCATHFKRRFDIFATDGSFPFSPFLIVTLLTFASFDSQVPLRIKTERKNGKAAPQHGHEVAFATVHTDDEDAPQHGQEVAFATVHPVETYLLGSFGSLLQPHPRHETYLH
jgi:hypothetical protein